ncbi:hypothetical protein [Pelagibacterium montanilacus]|uniref:hypothetical protein n=1 Tax=Pelagibacterium montanilacus TaxID=2185280 RepID=UPI000F8CE2C8|nr:hypothetical protein [Pelagibacterium montanilacus]
MQMQRENPNENQKANLKKQSATKGGDWPGMEMVIADTPGFAPMQCKPSQGMSLRIYGPKTARGNLFPSYPKLGQAPIVIVTH